MIADSSVVIIYARAGRLDLLLDTVGQLTIPPEVRAESVEAKPGAPDARRITEAIDTGRLEVRAADADAVRRLVDRHPALGHGEVASIALALASEAQEVLVDDHAARQTAKLEGVRPVGSLGVLKRAWREGAFGSKAEVEAALAALLRAGLWTHPELIEEFWSTIGGRP